MRHFGSPDALAKAFIKAYFTTSVYSPPDLFKFYAPDARVGRDGKALVGDRAQARFLGLGTQNGSTLTIVGYHVAPLPLGPVVSVNGFIEVADMRSGFAQTFVLNERDDRMYIVSDVSTVIDQKALGREADTFQVPNEFPLSNKRAHRPGPKAGPPPPPTSPPAPRVDDPHPPQPAQPPMPAPPPAGPPQQPRPPPSRGDKPEPAAEKKPRAPRAGGGSQAEQGEDTWKWSSQK
jgi:hypothetical protein